MQLPIPLKQQPPPSILLKHYFIKVMRFIASDGVHNANRLAILPEDEINLQQQWDNLITINNLESVVCITSTIKRGVLNKEEAERHNLESNSMYESSEIGGLGQLVDAALNSDRVVNFG